LLDSDCNKELSTIKKENKENKEKDENIDNSIQLKAENQELMQNESYNIELVAKDCEINTLKEEIQKLKIVSEKRKTNRNQGIRNYQVERCHQGMDVRFRSKGQTAAVD